MRLYCAFDCDCGTEGGSGQVCALGMPTTTAAASVVRACGLWLKIYVYARARARTAIDVGDRAVFFCACMCFVGCVWVNKLYPHIRMQRRRRRRHMIEMQKSARVRLCL